MKLHHYLLGLTVIMGALIATTPADAYVTTSQSARTFPNGTVLFTITYQFGSPTYDIELPIVATRGLATTTGTALGYDLLTTTGSTTAADTLQGLVLSNATIKDGRYFVPAGSSSRFTFVAILNPSTSALPKPHKLHVTALPFTLTKGTTKAEQHLNPSELIYYVTPLSLLTSGKITTLKAAQGITVTYTTK